jgi:hypothetical protein
MTAKDVFRYEQANDGCEQDQSKEIASVLGRICRMGDELFRVEKQEKAVV